MPNYMTELSPDNNTNVYQVKDKEASTIDLLKDTVGWTGKNLAKNVYPLTSQTQYQNALYIDADLESNTDYILSFDKGESGNQYYMNEQIITGGASTTTASGHFELSFTTKTLDKTNVNQYSPTYNAWMILKNSITEPNALSFSNVMLRKADILDSTYEPYHESADVIKANRDEVKDVVGWSGKNELMYPYANTTKTEGGITYTDNGNGSITISGTKSGTSQFMFDNETANLFLKKLVGKKLKVSGFNSDIRLVFWSTASDTILVQGTDGEVEFTFDQAWFSGNWNLKIYINTSSAINNVTIYPMLRKADIADDTYEPYHASVEQTLRDAEVIEGKNLLHVAQDVVTKTDHGITFTVYRNSNGELEKVDINGTSTEGVYLYLANPIVLKNGQKYIASDGGVGNNDCFLRIGDHNNDYVNKTNNGEVEFTADSSNIIRITVEPNKTINHMVMNPMLRSASESDPTFEPYYIPLKDSKFDRSEQVVLGAKNLIPYPFFENTRTENGITFTVNSDGSVTVNGTATANATFKVNRNGSFIETGKSYKLNGCPSGGGSGKYRINYTNNVDKAYSDNGNGVDVIGFATTYQIREITIIIYQGVTVDNLVFKPMLRLASDPDSTYRPYAMTNRELTEIIESACTNITSGTVNTNRMGNVLYKVGRVVTLYLSLDSVTASAWSNLVTIPSGFKPKKNIRTMSVNNAKLIQINADGLIQSSVALNNENFECYATWITG